MCSILIKTWFLNPQLFDNRHKPEKDHIQLISS